MEQRKLIPAALHVLPSLPYNYDELEPIIDKRTLEIHHDKHHKKYVDDLNITELALVQTREAGDFANITCLENALAFNGGGHVLHSVYWEIMTKPNNGMIPGEYTKSYLDWYFGGFDDFKSQFTTAAVGVQGSGWAILGYSAAFSRLDILACEKHQNGSQWGFVPILVCDVWEHAYYLSYQNNRAAYVEKWWSLVNWEAVEKRFLEAVNGVLPISLSEKYEYKKSG